MTAEHLELIWKLAAIIFACGVIYAKLETIRRDISRLEAKQDKYNHLQERVSTLEAIVHFMEDLKSNQK